MSRLSSSFLQRIAAALCLLVLTSGTSRRVAAHGLHGHIHVTGWAIENLPPGELRDLFDDPDVFHAALSGAMFPDTGYALDRPAAREYAEHSHWEPFIENFIQHVRVTYGPTYETKEEKMLIAFLLGCAAHGLQDELFDSVFLYETEERDGNGQDITDPGTDGFLVLDGLFRLLPEDYFPIDEVLPLYQPLNQPIDRALIEEHVRTVRNAYVNELLGTRIAAGFGQRALSQIPWAAENYLDPSVPGSLAAEIVPTLRHMQALWERLHGRFDEGNLVVHAWPDAPRRLRSAQHQQVASWVTLIFGKGVAQNSATASLFDAGGTPHPFDLRYTRWGGTSRLIRFLPTDDYVPGGFYTAILEAGATLVDGSTTTHHHEHTFQVECDPNDPLAGTDEDGQCEPVVVTDDPVIALPEPTATRSATATASPSATTTTEATSTPIPSATATVVASATHTAVATNTIAPTNTAVPAATHTATTTNTLAPTATYTPNPTHTFTPTTAPFRNDDDGDSCRIAPSGPTSSRGLALLLIGAAVLVGGRRRHVGKR